MTEHDSSIDQSTSQLLQDHKSTRANRKEKARKKAERYFMKHYPDSPLPVSEEYTKFSKREILLGNVLGKGAFGIVWEVNAIWLDAATSTRGSTVAAPISQSMNLGNSLSSSSTASSIGNRGSMVSINSNLLRPDAASRNFIAQHCTRQESAADIINSNSGRSNNRDTTTESHNARYAVKALSNHTVNSTSDDKLFFQGLIGMAMEARLLSRMEPHPNIIKMRAVSDCANPFSEDFFIVLDRLYGTLEDQLSEWSVQEKKNALWNAMIPNRRKKMWEARYEACHDLSSALAHLHHHRITHRDLKPQNIGYNIRGDLTLFDFGLSRELPKLSDRDSDGNYKMTGFCGSPRYMAPEIANSSRYDESCDVYSFAVLAWQIMTLEKPYSGFRVNFMKQLVWKAPHHVRPDLSKLYRHRPIQNLLQKAWSPVIEERPSMREIRTIFRKVLVQVCCRDGDDSNARVQRDSRKRRSTFVFRHSRRVPVAPSAA